MNLASSLQLDIDPNHQRTFGPSDCCGKMTSRVWGHLSQDGVALAAYFVEWTPGHQDKAANFDFIYGKWGEDADASDRKAISVAYRCTGSGPSFMVIDSANRPVAQNSLVGSATTRDEVLTTDLRPITFAMCDAIYLHDPRIAALVA